MSRRHSSTFNLTGTKRRATPSPTRSPARLPSARVPLRPPRPIAPPPVLVVDDPGNGMEQLGIDDQPELPSREEIYSDELAKYSHLVGCITTIDTIPSKLQNVDPLVTMANYEAYQSEECVHLSVARTLPLCTDFLSESETAVVREESVQFSFDPCLFIVRDRRNSSGVVKLTRMTLTCITCHNQKCEHCRYLQSDQLVSIQEIREEIEEEEESCPPQLISQQRSSCSHGVDLQSRRAVIQIANRDGIVRRETVHLQLSDCCKYLVSSLFIVPLSTSFALERRLLRHYESSFTQGGVSLNGYWNILREFRDREKEDKKDDPKEDTGEDSESLLSLSSLKRGWTQYLSNLHVHSDQFICPECGIYPETLVFDATTIGTRGDLGSYAAKRDMKGILASHTPGWMGTREMRREMREFSTGGNHVKTWVPPEFGALMRDSLTNKGRLEPRYGLSERDLYQSIGLVRKVHIEVPTFPCKTGSFNIRFRRFYAMIFADSPIPDILKVGSEGRARHLLLSIIDETIQFSEKETAEDLLRSLPVLYNALADIGFDSIPQSLRQILRSSLILNDTILCAPIRRDSLYGPPIDSQLEYYPNWALKRGRPVYQKDSRQDNMDCSQKIGTGHNKLSPGILIVTCHHRFTYGFTILTSCESPRHIFKLLITRMDGGEIPRNIVYDNSCHLSAYCLAREPGRFRHTRFFIDRFHERNHQSCSPTMRMSAYASDEKLAKINTQSVEQTNATLRHVANIIPFLSVEKYRKCLMLYLSRNQRKSSIK